MIKRTLNWLARKYLWVFATTVCATLRIQKHDSKFFEEYQNELKPFVVAFWHGSMAVGWFLHRPKRRGRIAALVSRSEDGDILSATLERWGYVMIRGSSHLGGKEAMQLMVEALDDGNSLCVTPDGPTGPRHRMKMGAVRAAQRSQVPLFLAGIAVDRKKRLRSWDQFELPWPFARVSVRYTEPIIVPPELRDAQLDTFLADSEGRLQALTAEAEEDLLNAGR